MQLGGDRDRKRDPDQLRAQREEEVRRPDIFVVRGIEIPPPSLG
jgi:hypothetical protein